MVTTNSFALNDDKCLQIYFFCVKRQAKKKKKKKKKKKNDCLKDVESTVVISGSHSSSFKVVVCDWKPCNKKKDFLKDVESRVIKVFTVRLHKVVYIVEN